MLRKKDAELTDHSAPTIFYMFEKVSACAEPVAAAQFIPRSRHSPRVVPFVQLSAALGSRKRRNPMAPTHQSWLCRRVRVTLVWLPPRPGPDPCRGRVPRARGAFLVLKGGGM